MPSGRTDRGSCLAGLEEVPAVGRLRWSTLGGFAGVVVVAALDGLRRWGERGRCARDHGTIEA